MNKRDKAIARFKEWLPARGAEMLVPTNQYEIVRFRGPAGVSIIYTNQKGALTFTNEARAAWDAFERGDDSVRFIKRAPRLSRREPVVQTILERDGTRCFYCAAAFTDDLPPTREHLVARTSGGPDHIANLFLACHPCNNEAGHMSAAEKIRLRDRKRRSTGSVLLVDLRPHVERLAADRQPNGPNYLNLLDRIDAVINPAKENDQCLT